MSKTKRFTQYLSESEGSQSLDESLILKGFAVGTKSRFNGSYSRLTSQISKVQYALSAVKAASETKDKISALTSALSHLVELHQIQAELLVPIMNLLVANSLFAEDLSKSLESHFPKNQRR
jgi:hypothetical protein